MTVRRVILPLGAVLVLALGVYLLIEVRAQVAPPQKTAQVLRPHGSAAPVPSGTPRPIVPGNVADAEVPSIAEPSGPPSGAKIPLQGAAEGEAKDAGADSAQAGEPPLVGPRLEAVMKEANRAYDRGDFEEAKTIAGRVLATYPTNIRMLRIIVSASCIEGDTAVAQANITKLPPWDQDQMKTRCARYGVTFP